MKKQIINIINFIRGVEPRVPELDLIEPVKNQIRLLKEYKLPGTFLIQYDAMMQQNYVDLLKNELDSCCEIGGWLEIVQPLVEKAGLKWRGRQGFPWDWHANVGLLIGYTPEEREKLIDVFMEDFKCIFGYYPQSVGSWIIDAYSLSYLEKKYGVIASCNCRDQWGTDGYTLWGGYYNGAYYPSTKNVFAPAQNNKNQINIPVFRMLGTDPIYQYDAGLQNIDGLEPSSFQPVVTLEPSCPEGGGSEKWVQWFFKENFSGTCLSFGYAQMGQENSFGWEAMSKGLEYQIKYAAELAAAGKLKIETLKDSAKWYRSKYKLTPASLVAALSDWKDRGHKSIWYNNRFYRVNFYCEGDKFWIRDIYCFRENYEERYLRDICDEEAFTYDNLPLVDGNRWSRENTRSGIYPVEFMPDGSQKAIIGEGPIVTEVGEDKLDIMWHIENGGTMKTNCKSETMTINCSRGYSTFNWGLKMVWSLSASVSITGVDEKTIFCRYNGYDYDICLSKGSIVKACEPNEILLIPEDREQSICIEPFVI